MQKEFTKEFMNDNRGCYSLEQLNNCSFMKKELISLDDILDSEIKLKDKYWFVCKKLATKEQNQHIIIGVAEIVLVIYENKYPDNKAPREAIQAAKDYLSGVIGLGELRNKRAAAFAAYAAAFAAAADAAFAAATYAAFAADAAAYAAFAADAAAFAAADADSASSAAAAAAFAAAADAAAADADAKSKFNDLLLSFLKQFCNGK